MRVLARLLCVCVTIWPSSLLAQSVDEKEFSTLAPAVQERLNKTNPGFWDNFSAGVLIGFYDSPIVREAEIRDGKVLVTDKATMSAVLGLQGYFPLRVWRWVVTNNDGKSWVKGSEISFGPYVGVGLSGESIIDTFSLGLAYSHRRSFGGIRLGVGSVFDPSVKRLAPGFEDGMAAPSGATSVPLVNQSAVGFQLMAAFAPGW